MLSTLTGRREERLAEARLWADRVVADVEKAQAAGGLVRDAEGFRNGARSYVVWVLIAQRKLDEARRETSKETSEDPRWKLLEAQVLLAKGEADGANTLIEAAAHAFDARLKAVDMGPWTFEKYLDLMCDRLESAGFAAAAEPVRARWRSKR